ncbi:uncharacterized protein BO80DRAFT_355414 [Aspergillus ibericus CBS 121593]|uniref:Uncharacterized protein n=1 Tax=Aspergillus ibericus CBS 121593 TaxID=1448316 RepID=A0A395GZH3_9EURO|nr:hypothetical protein BO80DRAFT_355414 [Aspergillus ibericus CBS 121593]RAL00991.1 hypothetical protein BO80DRAFT_355414 [Aspergillus ibericus CBS 121593]
MGTRGLYLIRCHGRYFIYYNQFDSYPEGLGDAIVEEIPEDPEKYREWLQSMRGLYAQLVKQFETQALPVILQATEEEDSTVAVAERYTTSFLAVDDRLELPPLQIVLPEVATFDVEWTYTLDLDREVLTIDNSLHLHLTKIPRGGAWIKYLDIDNQNRRVAGSCTPEEVVADLTWKPEVGSALTERYHQFDVRMDLLEAFNDHEHSSDPREPLLDATFSLIRNQYRRVLDGYVLEWAPDEFPFREIAFAVLSIAAGEVSFECIQSLDRNHKGEGYYLVHGRVSSGLTASCHPPTVLPRFLYESHLPGVRPGSAPEGRMYWFGNVLVHLASRLDLVEVEEASVAEVVEAGLKQGLEDFHAMVFSILDVVLLHVQKGPDGTVHVNRSPLMAPFEFDGKSPRFANGPRTTRCEERKRQVVSPFLAIMRLFDKATDSDLKGTRSSVLPNEVLGTIMDFSDTQTYRALGKVSAYSRRVSSRKLRLNDEYAAVGFDPSEQSFILEHLQSGQRFHSKLENYIDGNRFRSTAKGEGMHLRPVVGIESPTRRSILDSVSLYFSGATSRIAPYSKTIEMPKQSYCRYTHHYHSPEPERLFYIEDHMLIGSVEDGWGNYITSLNRRDGAAREATFVCGARLGCLLPPGLRQLSLDYCRNNLFCFIRCAHDESSEAWDVMMKYALRQLQFLQASEGEILPVSGLPVIMAFSTRVRLFFYVYQCAEAPTLETDAPQFLIRAAAQCTDPEPSRRLIPLITDGETIDLKERKRRDEFEEWIKVLHSHN